MAPPTPASSTWKTSAFMEPTSRLPYYEDVYGYRNADEEFDRFPDECEEESTSEEEEEDPVKTKGISASFFAPFMIPKRQRRPNGVGMVKREEVKTPLASTSIFKHSSSVPAKPFEGRHQTPGHLPKHRPQSSSPTLPRQTKKRKMPTPRPFGMFEPPSPLGEMNSAGEAMDDLLRGGAAEADLEDIFPILGEDESMADAEEEGMKKSGREEIFVKKMEAPKSERADTEIKQDSSPLNVDPDILAWLNGAEIGLERETAGHDEVETVIERNRGRAKANGEGGQMKQVIEDARLAQENEFRRTESPANQRRLSKRNGDRATKVAKEMEERGTTRRKDSEEGVSRKRKRGTASAVVPVSETYRPGSRKKPNAADGVGEGKRSKAGVRNGGFVVIQNDETDVEGYERY